jgi:PAP2 superfamily
MHTPAISLRARIVRAAWPLPLEILFMAILDLAYEALRLVVAPHGQRVQSAYASAHHIVAAEKSLHLAIESSVQHLTDTIPGGRFVTTWYYTVAYTPLFIGFFVVVWFRWRTHYAFLRNWFWTTHILAVLVFLVLPVAPPRFALNGVVDTTQHALRLGGALNWFQSLRNDYAAMPSLHIGQSFLFACALVLLMHRPGFRKYLWWLLPIWMAWVTMATANHYLLDGVGGVMTVLIALWIVDALTGRDVVRPWQTSSGSEPVDTLDDAHSSRQGQR